MQYTEFSVVQWDLLIIGVVLCNFNNIVDII